LGGFYSGHKEITMKRLPFRLTAAALAGFVAYGTAFAADSPGKRLPSFGTLEPTNLKAVQADAESWFTKVVKDAAKRKRFDAIWRDDNQPVLDRVVATLELDGKTAQLLADAANPLLPAPCGAQAVPAPVKDSKQPTFYRANLALAYAKALSNRRAYEEALDTLKAVSPEDVADPAAYLFHKAVAEFSLLQRDSARRTLGRLLDDLAEAPERYKTVGTLMLLDMLTWKEKDLQWIARKMDNSGRRLQLARGGPVTQKIQKDIVRRLDEIIKQLENQKKGNGNGGACPDGGNPGGSPGDSAGQPMDDSHIATNPGPGDVFRKKFKQAARSWGSLPEKERRAILLDLTKGMSSKHRQAIEEYFRRISDARRPVRGK
jgi:hypothetical protein